MSALQQLLGSFGAAAGGVPNFTWNPSDTDSKITLSGSNLTATRSAASATFVCSRATLALQDYQYFEMAVLAGSSNQIILGVGNLSMPIGTAGNYPGQDTNSWGYYGNNGQKYTAGSGSAYGSTYTAGDNIGIAYGGGKLWFRKNGTWQNSGDPSAGTGQAFSGLATTGIYAVAGLYQSPNAVTLKVATASLVYSVPSGFSAA
jgi:hypothetical protein